MYLSDCSAQYPMTQILVDDSTNSDRKKWIVIYWMQIKTGYVLTNSIWKYFKWRLNMLFYTWNTAIVIIFIQTPDVNTVVY